ncbi:hypothetical protein WAX74_11115 [Psychrobacillus sp. FJAT-51614]|uniref:Uncharacterized protein n=1 Tax=Psychrobacillus mangrovi TaxID=3117745 RepID=A0ABU8F5Y2_9BACI
MDELPYVIIISIVLISSWIDYRKKVKKAENEEDIEGHLFWRATKKLLNPTYGGIVYYNYFLILCTTLDNVLKLNKIYNSLRKSLVVSNYHKAF